MFEVRKEWRGGRCQDQVDKGDSTSLEQIFQGTQIA